MLQEVYNARTVRFLDDLDFEPQSIFVADSGAGLETVLLATLFPAASILCAATANSFLQSNIGSIKNVQISNVKGTDPMAKPVMAVSSGSTVVGALEEPYLVRQLHEQAGGRFDLVLLTEQTDWDAMQRAGIFFTDHFASARMLVVDSSVWLNKWHPKNVDAFKNHHRTFFMGWDIYQPQQQSQRLRTDLSQAAIHKQPKQAQTVKVFYHVAAKDHYRTIVLEHMSRLLFSRLYDRAEGVYCFILGETDGALAEARQLLESFGSKIHIASTSRDVSQFERFTLIGLRAHLAPTDVFLYMHTKGLRHNPSGPLNVYWWSFYMQYFLLREHERCIELLQGYDVVGVDWNTAETAYGVNPHFSGNFWWARADFYLRLSADIGGDYLDPEFYVGRGKPAAFSLWQSQNDMYKGEYPPSNFVDAAPAVRAWLSGL